MFLRRRKQRLWDSSHWNGLDCSRQKAMKVSHWFVARVPCGSKTVQHLVWTLLFSTCPLSSTACSNSTRHALYNQKKDLRNCNLLLTTKGNHGKPAFEKNAALYQIEPHGKIAGLQRRDVPISVKDIGRSHSGTRQIKRSYRFLAR